MPIIAHASVDNLKTYSSYQEALADKSCGNTFLVKSKERGTTGYEQWTLISKKTESTRLSSHPATPSYTKYSVSSI